MTYVAKINVRKTKKIPRNELFFFESAEDEFPFCGSAICIDF